MRSILIPLILLSICSPAKAETLLCIDEAAGGIKFLDGGWRGTSFKSGNTKYVVTESAKEADSYDVKELGKSYTTHHCKRERFDGVPYDQMVCGGLGMGFIVNFKALRFVEVYTLGYIENDKSGGNTPYVSGGSCSIINP